MYEVVPGVFLGSLLQLQRFPARSTDLVVNCTPDLQYTRPCREMVRLAVEDDQSQECQERMLRLLPYAVSKMREACSAGARVLVHCKQGQQRSCAVVAAYLMRTRGLTAHEAMELVRRAKPDAFFWQANFLPTLLALEPGHRA